ncbi:SigB/SigF/SigG family RNA polymerase sigma factor [Mycolicibacterium grossiae]|uniref:RNA polymerase subunit sigma n=1 Tax=Mycolicibacterium grossiae TaxID=1552759 RepID=A0A1E8PXD7_9MYCO|nr:SigB/SigF/SigG family RNA polymerase sigma factor [Mycolicibacterium grossiae]OFJ50354.1 RNA polymerase subunit sigma [Mycolicibacterium grossiae]QEM43545.1 SigB/SigF/SigG family RNA polymerase sigma factor [Mycolicibacterium grossiae]
MNMTASEDSDIPYSDVPDMFRILQEHVPGTAAHKRQRDKIIERCMPIARNIARRYRNRGESDDDLLQTAHIGLVNAVNRYDVNSGTPFLAFAVPTIMGELRRHFRDRGWAVKVPRRLKDLSVRLRMAEQDLTLELNRAPTPSEIAAYTDIDRQEVVEGLVAMRAYRSLSAEQPMGTDDDGQTIGETLGFEDSRYERILDVETVRPLIAALPEKDKAILLMRFFDNMTQSQIAQRIGVSQMQVSRLLSRTLATLREQL